jgi:hypothetical protein
MVKKANKKEKEIENKEENCDVIKIEAAVVLDCLEWDILVLNRNFKVLFANRAFLEKVKLAKCDAIDSFCYKITHHLEQPCQAPHDTCPLEEMVRTGRPAIETHTHFTKDNQEFLANTVVSPLEKFGEGIFLHVSMPIKNIETKKEEIEEALKKTSYILNVINVFQQQVEELKKTKKDLEEKFGELERINNLAVGRELRMIELKEEIKKLKGGA